MPDSINTGASDQATQTPPVGNQGQAVSGAGDPQAGDDLQAQLAAAQARVGELTAIQSGLDRRVAQLNAQTVALAQERDGLAAQLTEVQQTAASAATELTQFQERVPTLEANLAELQEQLGVRTAEAQRATLVAQEFPMLSALLETGGLPPFEDADSFRQKLNTIVTSLNLHIGSQVQQKLEGARPPAAPPASAPPDAGSLMADMNAAATAGDWTRYAELSKQWQAACQAS